MYYTKEQISAADRKSIAAYLLSKGEYLKYAGRETVWGREQVWINDCKWYSHYEQKGGYAISFVMKYFGLGFQSAVKELLGEDGKESEQAKEFSLPKANSSMNRVFEYLVNERFIDRDILKYFADEKLLYEDAIYHNCVFVGVDENGEPKHCHKRGTQGEFKMTVAGSCTEYAFHFCGESEWLFAFESPIDMLAFITLHSKNWKKYSYVALCSVSEKAILHRLESDKRLTNVVLCLDNDDAGNKACKRIKTSLDGKGYKVSRLVPHSKDWDEDLKAAHESPPPKEPPSKDRLLVLSCKYIKDAEHTSVPPMLTEKVKCAYTSVNNSNNRKPVEQVENLLVLLLLLARDESRKCLDPIPWDELSVKLCDRLTSGEASTLSADMQRLTAIYSHTALECDRDIFLNPILEMCADCIRMIDIYRRC